MDEAPFAPTNRFPPQLTAVLMSHIQGLAMRYGALKTDLPKLAELLAYSIGEAAPSADELMRFMRLESVQRELESRWDVWLEQSADKAKTWRLVNLAMPADPQRAAARLKARPQQADSCTWCWLAEPGHRGVLQPYRDLNGRAVGGVHLHRACKAAWTRLENMVMRSDEK
ncbi:hypothetical protein [Pseudomonas indica]|uniref:hypothetical protein n=1 Tax=Pseudomonas indica TaxID=137658 RepID=UPI0023F786C1|nr:hypothetical protein [Pseudomonas indica]MBU3055847.1 hypothetical protein [Pseudomonas indica]